MDDIKFYNFNNIKWSIDEIENLDFHFVPTYQINPSFNQYHHERYANVIGNDAYFLPNTMPSFVDEIMNLQPFKKYRIITPGFHRLQPGMILPLHKDPYKKFMKIYGLDSPEKITRIIVFMQDYIPGHYMQIEDTVITNYTKGCFVQWKGETLHAAFNLGIENRYTLQLTCHE